MEKKNTSVIILGIIAVVAFVIRKKIAAVAIFLFLLIASMFSRPEVSDDISRFEDFRSGPNATENNPVAQERRKFLEEHYI